MSETEQMYDVKLSEKEVKELGVERYARTIWRRQIVIAVTWFALTLVCLYFWGYVWGKVGLVLFGAAWIGTSYYQSRKEKKAGREFLEEVKNAQSNH